jgi:hypothetical protein
MQVRAKNAIQFLIALTTSAVAVRVDRGCAQTELPAYSGPQIGRDHRSRLQLHRDALALDFTCLEQRPICWCNIARSQTQRIKDRAQ